MTTPQSANDRTLARHPKPLGGDTARNLPTPSVSLSGFILNNGDESRQNLRIGKKPDWLRARVPGGEGYLRLKAIMDDSLVDQAAILNRKVLQSNYSMKDGRLKLKQLYL